MSSKICHPVCDRAANMMSSRRSARRSESSRPPQMPSYPLLTATLRHSRITGHLEHTRFANAVCSSACRPEPIGKNSSGSSPTHAARCRQSRRGSGTSVRWVHICPLMATGLRDESGTTQSAEQSHRLRARIRARHTVHRTRAGRLVTRSHDRVGPGFLDGRRIQPRGRPGPEQHQPAEESVAVRYACHSRASTTDRRRWW